MTTEALGETIRRVLRDAPFAMRQLAADAGLSYDVLRSWRSGRRRPSRVSAQRLADGLERRGQQLLDLSRELRQVANGDSAPDPAPAAANDPGTLSGAAGTAAARESGKSPEPGTSPDPSGRSAEPGRAAEIGTADPGRGTGMQWGDGSRVAGE